MGEICRSEYLGSYDIIQALRYNTNNNLRKSEYITKVYRGERSKLIFFKQTSCSGRVNRE